MNTLHHLQMMSSNAGGFNGGNTRSDRGRLRICTQLHSTPLKIPRLKLENRRKHADRAYEPRKIFLVLVLVLVLSPAGNIFVS